MDLRRPANWQVQSSPSRKHRSQHSITRGFRLLADPAANASQPQESFPSPYPTSVLKPVLNSSVTLVEPSLDKQDRAASIRLTPNRRETFSSWDVVEDLPLRWATDFVPLATSGSRLEGVSVQFFALWSDENRRGKGGQLLAIATKNNILLYETPRGERAFRFVKACI